MPRHCMQIGRETKYLQNITVHHLKYYSPGLQMSDKTHKRNKQQNNSMTYYGKALACSNHPGKPANKICSKCKRGFCKHCRLREDGQRKLCNQCEYWDCTPSPEDVLITGELRKAGTIFDIELLDSLIVSPSNYVSLRERGLGFDSKY